VKIGVGERFLSGNFFWVPENVVGDGACVVALFGGLRLIFLCADARHRRANKRIAKNAPESLCAPSRDGRTWGGKGKKKKW
jgi:hypothetical protein